MKDEKGAKPEPMSVHDNGQTRPAPQSVFQDGVNACKRELLLVALRRARGHRGKAARLLGISRPYLYVLCRQLGVPLPEQKGWPESGRRVRGSGRRPSQDVLRVFARAEKIIRRRLLAERGQWLPFEADVPGPDPIRAGWLEDER